MDYPALFILFFEGLLIGFIIAAPVGPIAILCMRRALSNHKMLAGLTGLGSALADAFYCTVTAFSLASIADFIVKYDFYLRLFGGILVAWIGFSILKNPSLNKTNKLEEGDSRFHAFTSAFFLTLSNPITLIVFATVFTAMGIAPIYQSFSQASTLVVGVFFGANAWWLSLIIIIHLMKDKLCEPQLLWINRFSGAILLAFSAYILVSLV